MTFELRERGYNPSKWVRLKKSFMEVSYTCLLWLSLFVAGNDVGPTPPIRAPGNGTALVRPNASLVVS